MIKLSDVSTERLITFLKYDYTDEAISARLTLEKHKIRDFQTLKNMVKNGRKEFNNDVFKSAIALVEANIAHANSISREPAIFNCNNYQGSNVYSKTLKYTDEHNMCDILICKSPAISTSGKFGALKDITIGEAKSLLSKVVAHDKSSTGCNAFAEKIRRFGNIEAECVRDAINFYEQQVLRQAIETKKRGINLFTLDKTQKQFIVRDQIKEIVKYLVDNADVCVWGEFTTAQKNRLINAVKSGSGYENQVIRQRIIEIISNYTTLNELESDVVKQKTLDRFIVK